MFEDAPRTDQEKLRQLAEICQHAANHPALNEVAFDLNLLFLLMMMVSVVGKRASEHGRTALNEACGDFAEAIQKMLGEAGQPITEH